MATKTLTATQKLMNLLSRRPATAVQIAKQCGFASRSSVTSVIASLRANGVNIRHAGTNKEGLMRYEIR